MRPRPIHATASALLAMAIGVAFHQNHPVAASPTWNTSAAAKHLDARQTWWMGWSSAQRDHETPCVSCHTTLPYAMARLTLRPALGETGPSKTEQNMLRNIEKRVNLWDEVLPFYNDAKSGPNKSIESRGTESVLNALILARYDAAAHTQQLSDTTRKAFIAMWSTQLTEGDQAGAWNWLNFHNAPWESNESQYYGATLAAIAVGEAPATYLNSPEIQNNLTSLRTYLNANYATQPLMNQVVVLWASTRMPELLTPAQRTALLGELETQQQEDGGWSLTSLGDWQERRDDTPHDPRSDGYATGLTVYVLKQSGISNGKPEMKRAIAWLLANQDTTDGLWSAYSLNKQRDPATDIGQFMNDAATAYSAMALEAVAR